ncbi:MAG: endonuclease/exonuclease/phosphatase family protein [Deltaproteobacteria bacterium]|nr:endonuclease/exonuclease/phosphatase family protein [Deltaproteobacteria bacterium]
MSYNIHGCVGADGRFDVERIASVLDEIRADVYLLQEVGDRVGREPTFDQAKVLASALDLEYAAGYTMPTGPWGYGNVVLARGRIDSSRRFDLSVTGREPRGCLRIDLTLPCRQGLTVVAVHLGLAWGERRSQIDQLLGDHGPISGVKPPLVLGGDFNDWPPGPATRLLGRSFLDAAWPSLDFRGTFPSRWPLLRLDRLYSRGRLRVEDYRVHRSRLAAIASDHLPIVAGYAMADT